MSGVNPLQDYDVFQPRFITRVINDIIVDPETYGAIDRFIPTRDQDVGLGTDIEWDVDVFLGGMIKPSDVNSSSPIVSGDGGSTKKWTPPHFREKTVIGGSHILNMRRLGTNNQMRTLAEQVVKWIKYLRTRVDNRIYWFKWEVVQNSAAFNVVSNDINYPLNYSAFGYHPVPGILWNALGANIIDDIIGFIAQFRNAATRPTDAYFGTNVLQTMVADPTIRALITAQIGFGVNPKNIFNVTPGQTGIIDFFQNMFAGIRFNYYPIGPVMSLSTILPNPGVGITATPVDGSVELFTVGEEVVLKAPDTDIHTPVLVNAVSEAAGTITITTLAGAAIAQTRGSTIRKKMEFLHPDRFVMFAEMPPGQLGGDTAAEFVTVANFHGDGGMENMQSGIVGKSINKEQEDPPRIELVSSFTGGVVVYHGEGPWLAARVL